ncbi:hypothetical protein GGI04_003404 [Coemansia thaxteri]|nr:hypothetical protein GGI04_003404 [Coemansia thaxteri]
MASYGPAVIGNSVILNVLRCYLRQTDLATLCLVQRDTWRQLVVQLYKEPQLHNMKMLENLANVVGAALPLQLGPHQCYGDFVHSLDLSMIPDRWSLVNGDDIEPIFNYCDHMQSINMNLCLNIEDVKFQNLFDKNPSLCESLTSLDVSELVAPAPVITHVLNVLSNLKSLTLSETKADDHLLAAVAKCMPNLEWLEINRCYHITDAGIALIAKGCPKLMYLAVNKCHGVRNADVIKQINAKGGWEDVTDSESDYSYDDEPEWGSDLDEHDEDFEYEDYLY